MISMARAVKDGDTKYIKVCRAYKMIEDGEITKEQAIKELGESYRNTVTMWFKK